MKQLKEKSSFIIYLFLVVVVVVGSRCWRGGDGDGGRAAVLMAEILNRTESNLLHPLNPSDAEWLGLCPSPSYSLMYSIYPHVF